MKTLEILKAARELISIPERWTQFAAARNKFGKACHSTRPEACAWCALGAVSKATESLTEGDEEFEYEYTAAARRLSGDMTIIYINDRLGHGATLKTFDEAIAALEAKPAA